MNSEPLSTQREWDAAYGEAMRWRDWQTCDQLLEDREQAKWYRDRPVRGRWWHRLFRLLLRMTPDA